MAFVTRQEALALGVTDAVLQGPRWQRVSQGLYLPGSETPGWLDRLHCLCAVLPDGAAFGCLTAARVYEWWLPPLPKELPVFVTVPAGGPRLTRRDLKVRRAALDDDDVRRVRGVPVTSPIRTLLDLAEMLSVLDLVLVADAALKSRQVTMAELKGAASVARRGIRTYRRMTDLAHPKSESAWETMLRLLHVLCGIQVEVQPDIFDAHGEWIARADLRIKGTKRLPEYDGNSHRDRARHQYDLQRDNVLARAGYERYGYIARDICASPEVIIGDAEDALGWPVDLDRLDGWFSEFNRSLFARGGVAKWATRWC